MGGIELSPVTGVRWNRDTYSFLIELTYSLAAHAPEPPEEYYSFTLAPALLVFENASEVDMRIDWAKTDLDLAIETMEHTASKPSVNGQFTKRKFELAFMSTDTSLSLWCRGYRMELLAEPVTLRSRHIPT